MLKIILTEKTQILTYDQDMAKMKINMILYENNYTHDLFYNDESITSLIFNEKSTKKILKEFLKEYFKGLKEMF